jgi:hypothetical protein
VAQAAMIRALPLKAAAIKKGRFRKPRLTLVDSLMEFPSFFVPLDARDLSTGKRRRTRRLFGERPCFERGKNEVA